MSGWERLMGRRWRCQVHFDPAVISRFKFHHTANDEKMSQIGIIRSPIYARNIYQLNKEHHIFSNNCVSSVSQIGWYNLHFHNILVSNSRNFIQLVRVMNFLRIKGKQFVDIYNRMRNIYININVLIVDSNYFTRFKDRSHDQIASAIYFSQLMGCMGFNIVVTITPFEHLHWIPFNPFIVIKKMQSQSHCVNSPLKYITVS